MSRIFSFGQFYGISRQEIKTPAFAFTEVEDFANSRVPVHTHETAHFYFVIKGEYETTVRDRKLACSDSTMIYHPAGTTHRDHFLTKGGRFLTVSLTEETNRKLLDEIRFFDHSVNFADGEIAWLGRRIQREICLPDDLTPVVLESMANELLVYAARCLDKSEKAPGWLKQAYELIGDRCSEPVTIAEIAASIGVHPLHLARSFRKFYDLSPGEFLRKRRIEFAADLLINSKKSLAEIALLSGFADQSQFTTSFRKNTGLTPGKFRELHNS